MPPAIYVSTVKSLYPIIHASEKRVSRFIKSGRGIAPSCRVLHFIYLMFIEVRYDLLVLFL